MRRAILNALIAGAFGAFCAYLGFGLFTWQYWVLYGLLAAAILNSLIEDRA